MSETVKPLVFPVEMKADTCPSCGIRFAFPEHMMNSKRRDHGSFYCPNGHSLSYSGESDLDRIKSLTTKLERAKDALRRIAQIDVGLLNRASLELAIEIANNALTAVEPKEFP